MSAMPPKADIRQRIEHVCFVPITEVRSWRWDKLDVQIFQENDLRVVLPLRASGWFIPAMNLSWGCSCFYCREGLHYRVLMHCPCWYQP